MLQKIISAPEFLINFKAELNHVDQTNSILIIKRTTGNGNIVVLSESEYTSMKETGYLLSTEANRNHLAKSIDDANAGRINELKLSQLWK